MPRTAAWGGVDVFVRVRRWCRADQQRSGACLASWGIVAEDEPRTKEREGFGILGVYLVGGGDVPSARTGCVGLPDGLHGLCRPRAQPAVVVNPAKLRSGRLTFKWAVSEYAQPTPRQVAWAAPWSPRRWHLPSPGLPAWQMRGNAPDK